MIADFSWNALFTAMFFFHLGKTALDGAFAIFDPGGKSDDTNLETFLVGVIVTVVLFVILLVGWG